MSRLTVIILSGAVSSLVYLFFIWFLRNKGGQKYTKRQEFIRQNKLPNKLLWPNWICTERVVVGFIGLYFYFFTELYWLGVILFTISAFLDGVDGLVARKCNLISSFGEEYDPLCDKLTYLPAMFIFAYLGILNILIITILAGIEFFGQFVVRYFIKRWNFSIAANNFGKIKAVLCFALIIYCAILDDGLGLPDFTRQVAYLCIILSIASAVFKVIPNHFYADILSGLNLVCGVIGINFVIYGHFVYAVIAVLAGQLFDLFDGRMAQKHGGTKLGPWFDNIADFVSFGLCPAIMIAAWGKWAPWGGWFIGIFYLIFVSCRLWRFLDSDKKNNSLSPGIFKGLPSPAGAIIVFGACLFWQNFYILSAFVIASSLFMISKIKFSHFGKIILKQTPKAVIVIFGACIAITVSYLIKSRKPELLGLVLLITSGVYVILGLIVKPKKQLT